MSMTFSETVYSNNVDKVWDECEKLGPDAEFDDLMLDVFFDKLNELNDEKKLIEKKLATYEKCLKDVFDIYKVEKWKKN